MEDKYAYVLSSDGELYHFKYIKREKINGKWKYWYKKATSKISNAISSVSKKVSSTAKSVKTATKKTAKEWSSIYKDKLSNKTSSEKKDSSVKTFVSKQRKKFKYIKKELINGKWRYWYPEDFAKNAKEKGSDFVNKFFGIKESSKPKVEYATVSDKDKAKDSEKERLAKEKYKKDQDKERNGVRKKELEKALEILKKPNTWFKKNNPLPDLKLKKKPTTLDEDMKLVNPKYNSKEGSDYDQNCSACSVTYDLRRRGYDVEAKSEKGIKKQTTIYDVADCYKDSKVVFEKDLKKKYKITNTKTLAKAVEKDMLSQGEGSRGILAVEWKRGGGHGVSWEVENGEVVIRDCQSGRKCDFDDYTDRINNMYYVRTDNLEVNDKVEKYVKSRKDD